MSFDWKKTLATVAPGLATALGGPLAGVATKALSDALLGKPDGTADELAQAMTAGGTDALLKLKEAENQFQVRMKELAIDLDRVHQADRASARTANVEGGTQKRVFWLTCLIFVVVIGVEAAVLFLGVPHGTDQQMVGRILGTLDAALLAALYYTYGSSAGSARKDELAAAR
jgi:hypothetical protein